MNDGWTLLLALIPWLTKYMASMKTIEEGNLHEMLMQRKNYAKPQYKLSRTLWHIC